MAFPANYVNGAQAVAATNIVSASAGTITAGPTLFMSGVADRTLSCTATLLAETNTLTLSIIWQVSNDASTWQRCVSENNTTVTVIGTGTAGADTAVTRVVTAPAGVYGWRYARASVESLVTTTAATGDTYAVAYNYAKVSV